MALYLSYLLSSSLLSHRVSPLVWLLLNHTHHVELKNLVFNKQI